MAKCFIEDTTLTAIGNAIRAKSGKADLILPGAMATEIAGLPEGGGDIVNGVIESYLSSSETISANTFVEFIGKNGFKNVYDKKVTTDGGGGGDNFTAVKLTENKLILFFRDISSTYAVIKGLVLTFENGSITLGTGTIVARNSSNSIADKRVRATKITDTKVLILYSIKPSTYDYRLYAKVVNISDLKITTGYEHTFDQQTVDGNTIFGEYTAYGEFDVVSLSENTVFVACGTGSSSGTPLGGIILTINGNDITFGSYKPFGLDYSSFRVWKPIVISPSLVLICYFNNNKGKVYLSLLSINGTTITHRKEVVIANSSVFDASLVKISESKILFIYGEYSDNYLLKGLLITTDGLSLTIGEEIIISNVSKGGYINSSLKLNNGNVLVVHARGTNNDLYSTELSINDSITVVNSTSVGKLSSGDYRLVPLLFGINIFLLYSDNWRYIKSMILEPSEIKIQPSNTKIDGITKTECTTEVAGEVWMLNTNV